MNGAGAYPHLFSPLELAGKRLKNRIVHVSVSPHFGAETGLKAGQIHYYANRARGGAAMVITEPVVISPHQGNSRVCAWNDSMVDDLSRWADAVEREDCRLLAQVQDPGRGRHAHGRSYKAIGASALPDDLSWTVPHVMSVDEIRTFIDNAAQSAARLKRCGFSGVEISAGHGHLFHQFLSARSNRREDEYGGDLQGRARFLVELATAIRSACGSDFILGVKLPGDDGIADSITPDMAAQIAMHLVASVSVDFLCYAQGTHHRTLDMLVPDDSYPRVPFLGLIRQLRKATPGVPVIALGRITAPDEAEAIVAGGDSELVGLGRALIADAAWPLKAKAGRASDIRLYTSRNTCWKVIIETPPIACENNPRVSLPDEVDYKPLPAAVKKRVVIVGAGIAGLEAAWTAAARGHDVTVFGKSAEVGGKTRLHAGLPTGESLSRIYDYQFAQAKKAGVRFELGAIATASDIQGLAPEVVVLATGSAMTWPVCLPDAYRAQGLVPDLRSAMRALVGRNEREGGVAVIYDMDQTDGTYAAAEALRQRFDQVILLTPRHHIADDASLVTRIRILRRFHEQGIEARCLVEPTLTDAFRNGRRLEYASVFGGARQAIDNVALFAYSTPRAPNDELAAPLRAAGIVVHLIGDCKVARSVMEATAEGHAIGTTL